MEKEEPQNIPLFRKEAMLHKKGSYLGKTTIISPISFSIWAFGMFAVAIALVLFLFFGKYAKRQEVIGMLIPNKGLINIYANAHGIVAKRFVQQGDKVVKGQLLYLISTEHHTLSEQGAFAQQIESLEKQITLLKDRVALYEKNLPGYKKLLAQKFISDVEYQRQYDAYLSSGVALREAEQKLIQTKGSGDYAIRAPDDGVISTLVTMVGEHVTEHKLLGTIIPEGAVLQGVLFVRSNAIGQVKVGQKVLLKYDAFPYQNFGLYSSTIESIDKSILTNKDIELQININPNVSAKDAIYGPNEPFYRVIVNLKQQVVMVYGKPYPLAPGMTIRGSMIGDERSIWQWILDPIYSLRGSLVTP